MSILVTGASGFIGTHLVQHLVQRGESVHLLCRPTSDLSIFKEREIRIFRGDILDPTSVERAMEGCDRVFHLAAYARNWSKEPQVYYEINVEGLKNIFEVALKRSVKKVVFTSSSLTIGPSNGSIVNESAGLTDGFFTEYQRSKYVAEKEVEKYVEKGLQVVTVNPTRVFGKGLLNEGNSVTKLIQLYLNGKWRIILGDGEAIGNYVFVEDVVVGHLLAMEKGRTGEKYLLGGENVAFKEFISLLSELSNRYYWVFSIPPSLALAYSQLEKFRARWFNHYPMITPGWVRIFLHDWGYSCEKAERELGYRVTSLRKALKLTIQWLEQEKDEETS